VFTLPHLLRAAANRAPDHQAVRCSGRWLTYADVDRQADALAALLSETGVVRGDRVAIYLPKRVEVLPALYGVMRAGAAYVPLDPKGPPRRAGLVASDCSIAGLITTRSLAERLLPRLDRRPRVVVLLDEDVDELGEERTIGFDRAAGTSDRPAPDPGAIDVDLAYILYTSGSTGMPKGAMLSHRNALTFVEWCASTIGVDASDRLTNHAPLHFDLSVFDLYLSAYAAATVVLIPEDEAYLSTALAGIVDEERITVWYSVPSALQLLVSGAHGEPVFPSLRTIVFAGEVYPTPRLRELAHRVPHATLWNLYGPTETNVCTYHRVDEVPEDDRPVPIGRACENTEVFALTEAGTRAGVGETGELYVYGSTVMMGYWASPTQTAAALVDDPFERGSGLRVYRTGDLVRLRPDGAYDFLGRRDHQIKSRGYRIELGEIEAALASVPGLREAVAVALPHERWDTEIAARVVLAPEASATSTAIKRHLSERIPRYMIPTIIELVDELPRTSNGKVDRRRVSEELLRSRPAG
jgi:L-proline---[L-prolyl-carrier protein] ligase